VLISSRGNTGTRAEQALNRCLPLCNPLRARDLTPNWHLPAWFDGTRGQTSDDGVVGSVEQWTIRGEESLGVTRDLNRCIAALADAWLMRISARLFKSGAADVPTSSISRFAAP